MKNILVIIIITLIGISFSGCGSLGKFIIFPNSESNPGGVVSLGKKYSI